MSYGVSVADIGKRSRIQQAVEHVFQVRSSSDVSTLRSRAKRLLDAVTEAGAAHNWHPYSTDPEELRYPAKIFVWVRWFIHAAQPY